MDDKQGIEEALASGIITQDKGCDKCCFVHDHFKGAAMLLLPENPKQVYLNVARKLLQLRSTVDLDGSIVDVTNLYYTAKDMIDDDERVEVTELFLFAGEKAMRSTASSHALDYFQAGIEILSPKSWETRYSFCHKLYCNAAKSAYCNADYERMDGFIEEISDNATSLLDEITPSLLQIRMYNDKHMFDDAYSCALSMLDRLGERMDFNETILTSEIEETTDLVIEFIDQLTEMKEMVDKKQLAVMKILHCVGFSAYFAQNPKVLSSVALKMVQLTLKNGISKYSCLGFSAFAIVLCRMGDVASHEIGDFSVNLVEKMKAKELIPIVNAVFYITISPFFTPIWGILNPLRKTAIVSFETGSHHYSSQFVAVYSSYAFFCGENLTTLFDDMNHFDEVLKSKLKLFMSIKQAILNIQDVNIDNPSLLSGEFFDYNNFVAEDGWKSDNAKALTICCVVAYLFDDIQTASRMAKHCKALGDCFGNLILKLFFCFYDGLVASSLSEKYEKKDEFMENIAENIKFLTKHVENAPENFLNKIHLLKAELAAIQKKEAEAKLNFEKAISLSKANGLLSEEAICCERAAIFYFHLGIEEDAKKMLFQSYDCYKKWGANSKIYHMITRYPIIARSLKKSSIELESDPQSYNIDGEMESVSMITDVVSWTGMNTLSK